MFHRFVWIMALVFGMGVASAATPVSAEMRMGVTPSVVEFTAPPGGSGTIEVTVLNNGDGDFTALLSIEPFDRAPASYSAPEWLSLEAESVDVAAGESTVVKVNVQIPDDQESGAKYAFLSVSSTLPGSGDNATSLAGQLLVPFFMTVEGKEELSRKAEITRFAAVIELDARLGFRAQIENEGNVHLPLTGKALVYQADGSDYGNLDFEEGRAYPQTSVTLGPTSTLPVAADASMSAEAEINTGAKKPITAQTSFTFTPNFTTSGSVCENLDRGPTISAILTNQGDIGIVYQSSISIATADGQMIGQSNSEDPVIAWPSDESASLADLPDRLPTGDYLLTIQYLTGASADPVSLEVPFSIGGTGPNVAPICPQPTETPAA